MDAFSDDKNDLSFYSDDEILPLTGEAGLLLDRLIFRKTSICTVNFYFMQTK